MTTTPPPKGERMTEEAIAKLRAEPSNGLPIMGGTEWTLRINLHRCLDALEAAYLESDVRKEGWDKDRAEVMRLEEKLQQKDAEIEKWKNEAEINYRSLRDSDIDGENLVKEVQRLASLLAQAKAEVERLQGENQMLSDTGKALTKHALTQAKLLKDAEEMANYYAALTGWDNHKHLYPNDAVFTKANSFLSSLQTSREREKVGGEG